MAVVVGTIDPETLFGGLDADTISGLDGNDTIYAFQQDDSVEGGAGDDSIDGSFGSDTLHGDAGNDTLIGGLGVDLLYGGSEDDVMFLNDPNYGSETTAYGGSGNDIFILFDKGPTTSYGGDGIDTLSMGWIFSNVGSVFINVNTSTATSTTGPDLTFSEIEALNVFLGEGEDTVIGGAEADNLDVGRGGNQVDAGAGNDRVTYTINTANTLQGGQGQDTLVAQSTDRSLYFIINSQTGAVDDGHLSSILGFERYEVYGSVFDDIVSLWTGGDRFLGNSGDDTVFGNAGNDSLHGDAGNDEMFGGAGGDVVAGGFGNDEVHGGRGNDHVRGGQGDDSLFGGDGRDLLMGGINNDVLSGGAGRDTFVFNQDDTSLDTITDFQSGFDTIRLLAAILDNGPGPGAVDPGIVSYETANGSDPQFIISYNAALDETWLVWDPDGPNGLWQPLIRFSGDITLVASDILLI